MAGDGDGVGIEIIPIPKSQTQEAVYICNTCEVELETHYHCFECGDFDLCFACYGKEGHRHEMKVIGPEGPFGAKEPTQQEVAATLIDLNKYFVHAAHCRDVTCKLPYCRKLKRIVRHTRICPRRVKGRCFICKVMTVYIVAHARECKQSYCLVPLCKIIKQKVHRRRLRLERARLEMEM